MRILNWPVMGCVVLTTHAAHTCTIYPIRVQYVPGFVLHCFVVVVMDHAIQINICVEYQEMLPRPRLVCQVYRTKPAKKAWVALPAIRVDSMFAPSQWETALLCNDVSHWLGASPNSALPAIFSTDLNLFNYIQFSISKSIVGGMGTFQLMNGPVVFHHGYCDHNEAPAKSNQI